MKCPECGEELVHYTSNILECETFDCNYWQVFSEEELSKQLTK